MAKITLKEVSKTYNGVNAVKSLSMKIKDGELIALLGPPGAGKSSTVKMIAGVENTTEGEILFDDQPVNKLPPNLRDVAMVFVSYALYPHMTAFENIAYPLHEQGRKLGYTNKQIKEEVLKIADLLQFREHLQRKPGHLSGGQKQRVALSRALVRHPRVLLLDEPIAHLDARLRHHLRGELKRIQRERKTTTIYSTPDYLEAIAMADRVAVIFDGELHQFGTPTEILNQPASAKVASFVGDPPMNILPVQVVTDDGQLWFKGDEFDIQVPVHLNNVVEKGNFRELLIGIRPGDIVFSQTKAEAPSFTANLYVVEKLHRKSILNLEKKGNLIKINTSIDFKGKIGDTIWLKFPEDKLFIFDPKTSLRL
ncbi:MAG: ABC transporter ATP-binding protein [Anaerolineaceae bacterium]|nr:ABC transporter ATP-binding protein [Anaerolineaceae bacterium]